MNTKRFKKDFTLRIKKGVTLKIRKCSKLMIQKGSILKIRKGFPVSLFSMKTKFKHTWDWWYWGPEKGHIGSPWYTMNISSFGYH